MVGGSRAIKRVYFGAGTSARMVDEEELQRKLMELTQEHRDLDAAIEALSAQPPFDQIQVQRLKKRKLQLKDLILRINSQLLPDIIA